MKGASLVKLGLGLLFTWGGLEKLFEGFLGGVGLDALSGMLGNIGFGFLGGGTYALAIVVAVVELLAGLVLLGGAFGCNTCAKYVKYAGWAGVIILAVAILTVHLPNFDSESAMSWANLLLHLSAALSFAGVATCDSCKA